MKNNNFQLNEPRAAEGGSKIPKEVEVLNKCPYCQRSVIVNIGIQPEGKLTPYNVECFNCGVKGPTENSKWGAIDTWNQMTKKPIIKERLEVAIGEELDKSFELQNLSHEYKKQVAKTVMLVIDEYLREYR